MPRIAQRSSSMIWKVQTSRTSPFLWKTCPQGLSAIQHQSELGRCPLSGLSRLSLQRSSRPRPTLRGRHFRRGERELSSEQPSKWEYLC